jgi:hypothetical protein
MWTDKYKVVGIVPGRVIIPKFGVVDFSDEKLPIELMDKLYKAGCSHLKPIVHRKPKPEPKSESPE